ncbi:MAG TPA: serine hydrolase [Blastocatellia bacterium]|nr:serine hydrolase [Blastocatellia bacterium]
MKTIYGRMSRVFVTLAAVVLFAASAPAQTIDSAGVDRIMEEALKAWQVPGASLAIVQNDKVVHLKGYGVKEKGSNAPVTPDTLFAIGSTSKAFTTTAMAMLVDEGKINWDDPVRKHIEFFRLSDPLASDQVTLRDIITHRTGLSRHDLLWYRSPWSREETIRRIGYVKLTRPFRSVWQYQNIMYTTAGYVVGVASKSSWEEFVKKRIFDPLGMTGANFSATVAEKAADRASPHVKERDGSVKAIPWFNLDNAGPAGSINAGARDMSRWVRFQLGNGTFEGKRLVSAANLAEMHTPQMVLAVDPAAYPHTNMMSYGMAWFIHDYHGQHMIAHTGGIDGFRARIVLLPKQNLGIVILTNSSVGTSSASMHVAATNSIVDLLLGLPKTDWNARYGEQVKNIEAQAAQFEQRREARRQKDTRPSRELASYAGTYEDAAYGKVEVSVEGGALVVEWSRFKAKLDHYHYDTFLAKDESPLDGDMVVFHLGAGGEVEEVSMLGTEFKRVRVKNGN